MKVICSSILCIILFQFIPCAVDGKKFDIKWGSTNANSGLYVNTTSIVNIVNQAYPQNISAVVVETEGFADNLTKIKNKSIHIGPASIVEAYNAYSGLREYKDNAIPELRSLWGGYVTPIHIFTSKESGITSIDKLGGSTFAINPGTTSGKLIQMFLDALEIKPNYKSFGIALSMDAMKSGAVQCWYKAGYKDSAIIELEQVMEINILSINEEMIEKINKKYPGYGMSIAVPKGLYKALTENQLSLAYVISDFAHKNVPEQIVYDIVKAVWGKKRQLTESLSTLKQGRFEDMYRMAVDYGLSVPFHPGAAKFYQEKLKLNIPEILLPPEMKRPTPVK
jgi:TRAP transporter TAXI family solute receptor